MDKDNCFPNIKWPEFWLEMSPDVQENYEFLLVTPRPQRGSLRGRRGFVHDPENKCFWPDAERLGYFIRLLIEVRVDHIRSLRESVDMVIRYEAQHDSTNMEGVVTLSVAGLSKIFTELEKDLGVATVIASTGKLREHHALSIRQREIKGDMRNLMKKPKQHSRLMKRRLAVKEDISDINKEIQVAKARARQLQTKVVRRAAKLGLPGDPTKLTLYKGRDGKQELLNSDSREAKAIEKDTTKKGKKATLIHKPTPDLITQYTEGLARKIVECDLMDMYQEIMVTQASRDSRKIAFLPTPRQYLFMSADEHIVLYGGQAGGGKSYSMVLDALRYVSVPHYKGVIIRKTTKELGELIDNSRELYPMAYKGARYNASMGKRTFPSGAQIFFGYLDAPADKWQYQGHQYQYVGFDELSTQPTEEGFRYVHSRCRNPKSATIKIKPAMRATANPGSLWVYEMFIKDREPMVPFIMPGTENNKIPITMKFIPAQLSDNPHLDNDGEYRSILEAQPELEREQLLLGNWLISVDNMFPEFKPAVHVVEPFDVPRHWNRTCGLDYGYRDPSAGVWFATNPDTGAIVVYDEFLERGLTGKEFALAIEKKEEWTDMPVDHPIDWGVFAKTGHIGPTIAESMLDSRYLNLRRADKNREAGWVQIHETMRNDIITGIPQLTIMNTCKGLIRQLQTAKIHKTKPNDLDDFRTKEGHWDLLDAFRYGVMSRPRRESREEMINKLKLHDGWGKIKSFFTS